MPLVFSHHTSPIGLQWRKKGLFQSASSAPCGDDLFFVFSLFAFKFLHKITQVQKLNTCDQVDEESNGKEEDGEEGVLLIKNEFYLRPYLESRQACMNQSL